MSYKVRKAQINLIQSIIDRITFVFSGFAQLAADTIR